MAPKPRPLAERFWEKVLRGHPDACWIWRAATQGTGYGKFGLPGGRFVLAHRMAWELTHGPIPDGLSVCHTCDVRLCCNPRHLFLGTTADNLADMRAKGRGTPPPPSPALKGEQHGRARLTEAEVTAIRNDYGPGTSIRVLAERYGVSPQNIHRIVTRKMWTHLP